MKPIAQFQRIAFWSPSGDTAKIVQNPLANAGSTLAPPSTVRPSLLPEWLASVPALIARAIAYTSTSPDRSRVTPVRVLRSIFRRGDETLTCELALDEDGESYELRTSRPPAHGLEDIEKFCSVMKAFDRQSEIEAALVKEGWTLESHESFLA